VIAIDPKGDFGNLMFNSTSMQGEDLELWVDPQTAVNQGMSGARASMTGASPSRESKPCAMLPHSWDRDESLDISGLINAIQTLPMRSFGVIKKTVTGQPTKTRHSIIYWQQPTRRPIWWSQITSARRAGSAMSKANRTRKESQDVKNAEENAETLQVQLKNLEAELKTELAEIEGQFDAQKAELEEVSIRATSSNIHVSLCGVLW
jgi:hypothetical protein